MQRVALTRELRQLIRIARTDIAKLSQRAAAEQAGLSEVWWRQIEKGQAEYATADVLARMSYAVGVTPAQLRRIGQHHVANLVQARVQLLEAHTQADSVEAHLMLTPGLTNEQKVALVTLARTFRRET